MQLLHVYITWLRYLGAKFRTRGRDDSLIAQFRSDAPDQVFYIVGSGGTVNDLSVADCEKIENGVSVSLNMGGVAPLAFSIYSIEAVNSAHQKDSLARKVRDQSKSAVFWHQDRKKHASSHIDALEREFPMHRYVRASVSVNRDVATFRRIFRDVMRPRVFDAPDLNICFAVTGSVARATLLGCALGYRRFCYVGVDLGSTRYFWHEDHQLRGAEPWQDLDHFYDPNPDVSNFQGGPRVVPTFFEFLKTLHDESGRDLEFTTIDPKGRSLLTEFLKTGLRAPR